MPTIETPAPIEHVVESRGAGAAPYAPVAWDVPTVPYVAASAPVVQAPNETASMGAGAPWEQAHTEQPYQPYPGIPPMPPDDGMSGGATGRPKKRPHRAKYVLLASALLATLAVGVGGGVAFDRANAASTVIGSTSAPQITVSASTTSLQQTVEQVAKAVEPSVVKITSVGNSGEAVGSGDILTSDGYIVTNDHVVAGFSSFTVTLSNGKTYAATLVGQDAQDDLAVLKINATGLTPIAFADSSKVTVGEFAVAVGNPLALQESATLGTVSAVNGTASEAPSGPADVLTGLIQTTATIAPGNSGGALVNLQGQLIGIPTLEETNTDTGSASGLGYAIPANRVQYVAQQLIQNGKLTSTNQGFLGIQGEDVSPQVAAQAGLSVDSGVLVTGFGNDAAGASPAQQAGLQTGDVITAVNGRTISGNSDLASAIESQAPGTKVTLTVQRGTSQVTVSVTLGERPANG